ncbi:MAG: regulatory iron-sulfur-containing complex subunit RicT [bacterium]
MKIASIKITEWDDSQVAELSVGEYIKKGDSAIIKDEQNFEELAVIEEIINEEKKDTVKNLVLRKATDNDFKKLESLKEKEAEYLKYCNECVKNLNLDMKLVDCHISFDEQRIIFVFTAEGRIDFRELVKMLNWTFRKAIRMRQIGIRDEAKILGDLGTCGRALCCRKFLNELSSVSSEVADNQQINNRGADRISGICGRLKCCLNYEKEGYKELAKKLPPVGAGVKFKGKKLKVIGWHILKQTVDLEIDKDTKIEVEIDKLEI